MNKKSLKEYRVWRAMKARCYAPSQTKGNYKKDGIQVCTSWRNSFETFIRDMGYMPDDRYSIERINVKGDYEPGNCRWILQNEQPKNRSNTIWVYINGKMLCLKDVAQMIGMKYTTLYMKYKRAGNDLKAVDTAIREYYGMKPNTGN